MARTLCSFWGPFWRALVPLALMCHAVSEVLRAADAVSEVLRAAGAVPGAGRSSPQPPAAGCARGHLSAPGGGPPLTA
jgi:hypothetical protein